MKKKFLGQFIGKDECIIITWICLECRYVFNPTCVLQNYLYGTPNLQGRSVKMVEVVSQCLGLAPHYCCPGPLPHLVEAFVYSPWMRSVYEYFM